jgi:SSS family transporter
MKLFYWLVFLVYCAAMLYLGVLGMKRTKDADDYFVAGRSFGLWIAVPLFVATYITAGTMVGYAGYAYTQGWFLLSRYCIGLLFSMIMLQLFSRKFYNSKSAWYTTTDLFAERFEEEWFMRTILSVYLVINTLLSVIMGTMGIGTVLEVFLGLPYMWSIVIVGSVFIFYTAYGGMFSVAWTNVVQCILLFFCMVVASIWAVNAAGGLSVINAHLATLGEGDKLGAMLTFTFNDQYSLPFIIGTWLNLAFTVPCYVYYQRIFFSLNSERTARAMIGFSSFAMMVVYFVVVLIGVAGTVLLPDLKNSEQIFPQIVLMMPAAFAALTVAGIVAAIQSSIDGQLLAASTIATHDFYKNVINKKATQKQLVKFSCYCTIVLGIVAMILAIIRPGSMMDLYNIIIALNASVIFPTMFLGLFWKRTTKHAAIFGLCFGAVGCYGWLQFGPRSIPPSLVIVPLALIGMVVISFYTKPVSDATIAKFFDVRKS